MNHAHIIKSPIVTEKSLRPAGAPRYAFWVDPKATKKQIFTAITDIFGVTVTRVNTLRRQGKTRRVGRARKVISIPLRKKAIVILAPGQNIPQLEIKES